MVQLKNKLNKKKNLNSQGGFSLIETIVVMAIVAIMFTLAGLGMISAKKQNEVMAAAREFQATIRLAANESISVADASGIPEPPEVSAKAWSIAVTTNSVGATSYVLDSYYPDGVITTMPTPATLTKSSKSIVLKNNVKVKINIDSTPDDGLDNGTDLTSGTINLIFNSPFAKFKAKQGADPIISGATWAINEIGEASYNSGTTATGIATFTFFNGKSYMDVKVKTNLDTGETSI